jgi:uncharacterized surface protein with fasciclin (FAS1) repeats
MTRSLNLLAALVATTTLAACGGEDADQAPAPNVVQLAQSNPDLSILAEAVGVAGLADDHSAPGPFTVFAPTNAAFAALLGELGVTKAELFADTQLLTTVLTYHVLGARVERSAIPLGKAITPLQGSLFKIEQGGGGLTINDGQGRTARITAADVQASNGVVHVIDAVILPPVENVVQLAQSTADFGELVAAVTAADLAGALSYAGPFTVFAPTDAAFADLLTELGITRDDLFSDTALLAAVLTYHVIPGRVLAADVVPGTQPATLQGQTFDIGADLVITDQRGRTANIVATDVFATNGVIHVIDRVLLPAP